MVAWHRGGEGPRRAARLRPAVLWVGSLFLTFQLGSWRGARPSPTSPTPEASGEPVPPASPPEGAPRTFGEGDVRRWIVEAVRAEAEAGRVLGRGVEAPPSVAASAAPGPGTPAGGEPDFDPILADATFGRGEDLLRAARARGAWTLEDAAQLRGMMPQLPAAQRHELADALFAALGDGRLRAELPGPPL